MVFIHRANQELSRPEPAGKVIKAGDFWAWRKARQAVAEGVKRRDQIIGDARAAYEAEKQRGYREGREAARLEQTANMLEIIGQTVHYFSKVEAQMVDLVLDAVRRIASDFDDREKVLKVVRNSLALVRSQKHVRVKVHPSRLDDLKSNIHSLKDTYPGIENMEAIADFGVADDACVIESDIGQVEASMSGQIEALRSTFERVFGSGRPNSTGLPEMSDKVEGTQGTNPQTPAPTPEFSGA